MNAIGIPPTRARASTTGSRAPAPASTPSPASRSARRRSARSTWPTPTRPSRTAAGSPSRSSSRRSVDGRGDLYDHSVERQAGDRRRAGRRHRRRRQLALQQVVQSGTGTAALAWIVRRPARPAPRPTRRTRCPRRGSPATRRSSRPSVMYVRGKGNEQLDGWLPSYFGGAYPADTWTAVMNRDMDGVEEERLPRAGLRRRRGPDDGHTPTPPPPPTNKPKPSETPSDHRGADQDADAGPPPTPRPRRPTQAPPTTDARRRRGADGEAATRPARRRRRRRHRRRPAAPPPRPLGARRGRGDRMRWYADRRSEGHIHPTQDDPVVAALSEGVGGPSAAGPARTAGGRRCAWSCSWPRRPSRSGMVQKSGCVRRAAGSSTSTATPTCATPTCPTSTPVAGWSSWPGPTAKTPQVRSRYEVMEYPVGISYFAYGAAWVTHWLAGVARQRGPRRRARRRPGR